MRKRRLTWGGDAAFSHTLVHAELQVAWTGAYELSEIEQTGTRRSADHVPSGGEPWRDGDRCVDGKGSVAREGRGLIGSSPSEVDVSEIQIWRKGEAFYVWRVSEEAIPKHLVGPIATEAEARKHAETLAMAGEVVAPGVLNKFPAFA